MANATSHRSYLCARHPCSVLIIKHWRVFILFWFIFDSPKENECFIFSAYFLFLVYCSNSLQIFFCNVCFLRKKIKCILILKRKLEPYPMCLTGALRTARPSLSFRLFPCFIFFSSNSKGRSWQCAITPGPWQPNGSSSHVCRYRCQTAIDPKNPHSVLHGHHDCVCVYIYILTTQTLLILMWFWGAGRNS